MATSTATAIELESRDQQPQDSPERTHQTRTEQSNSLDDVAEASRIADAGAPEGGYGWIAVACSGILAFWSIGATYSWGVLQSALITRSLLSASVLPWVGSLSAASVAFMAIINARILTTLGSQRAGLLAMGLIGVGELISSFSTKQIAGLFIGTGVITGCGIALAFMVVSCIPAQYFSRKRGLATGIIYAMGGAGGAAISFMSQAIIQKFGIAWTFRILSFITFATGLPAAYFNKDRISPNRRSFIDWTLFRDSRFILLFLCGVVGTFPLLVPPFFLPLYSASVGLPGAAAGLVAGYNLSSAMGRIIAGYMCDKIGSLNSLLISLSLVAVSMLVLWPVSQTLGPLIAFVVINGASCGAFFSVFPTVAGQVFGSARVSVAMGMLVTGWGGGYLMGAPIAGYLLADFGGEDAGFKAYRPAIYYAGSMALGAAGLVALARLRMQRQNGGSIWFARI